MSSNSSAASQVSIYTDGGCSGNPGPGGYGVVLLAGTARKELSGGFRWTTNNRMELMALILALEALKRPCSVAVFSDSQYVLGAYEKGWMANWKRNGWRTASKKPVQNQDLWQRLDTALAPHQVNFTWVKGHANNAENNRCDELAVAAWKAKPSHIDAGYEAENPFKPN